MFILLGAAAVSGTGAATIGTGLTQPPASGLPMLLAGTTMSTHRRLLDNIFANRTSLRMALNAYDDDAATAEATYGPIANWDVSGVSDMSYLFWFSQNFNADISSWDTSGVTNMNNMFYVCSTRALAPSLRSDPPRARCLRRHRPARPSSHLHRTASHPLARITCSAFDSAGRGGVQPAGGF